MSIADVKAAIEENDEDEIVACLTKLMCQTTETKLESSDLLISLVTLKSDKLAQQFAELAAEWAKLGQNRKFFTDKKIIDYFLELLGSSQENVVIGAVRVLGNVCYENGEACRIIDRHGLRTAISLLEQDKHRTSNLLTVKTSGFLMNLLISSEEMLRASFKYNLIEVIETVLNRYMKHFNENQTLFYTLLTVLNNIFDFVDNHDILFTESLCGLIIRILKQSQTPKILALCLEILHGQSDQEEIMTILAQQGICELVFEHIEKYRADVDDEETRSVMKMACEMIVIVLTGDDCMNLLYDNGKGKLYEDMLTWLDSDDPDLLTMGVLALGNFARKDTHCIQMVQQGISKKLINLLARYNTSQSDTKVQHALLSTLKNLVIPAQNKPVILAEGLIDVIYPMIHSEQYFVIFKLLGTFRMIVDGQEQIALELISRREFLEKLMFWCHNSDHFGVRGEIPRLLAWLIKNCHSFAPFQILLQVKNSVKCLVEMIASNHALMQNESLYSLNLLCVGCTFSSQAQNGVSGLDESDFFEQLINADIGKNLQFAINKYGDKMNRLTIENLVVLLQSLAWSADVVDNLKEANLAEEIEKLKTNPQSQTVLERLDNILVAIN